MQSLFSGVFEFHWQFLLMYAIGGALIYLAIAKDYEPMLLLPIGFGAILANLPLNAVWGGEDGAGVLRLLYNAGILTELFPVLIFIGIGAMTDFRPLFSTPKMVFFGAAAQFGIFATIIAVLGLTALFPALKDNIIQLGLSQEAFKDATPLEILIKAAAAIGIIGTADGPTSIVVAGKFAPQLLGPISVAAYSYMALVPIIQPPVIKALTTKKERCIEMEYSEKKISKTAMIIFPIAVTVVVALIAPPSAPLIGLLMFGNLIKECGVLERLNKAAQNELANIVTLLLGITIGATMEYSAFLQPVTIAILALGLVAFVFDTAGGVLFAKLLNVFSKKKINPMIGAAGISAFPMSARLVQKMYKNENPGHFILMQAVSANVSGQLGSVVAGSLILTLVPMLLGH
ncbi:sodium ion-translocating decarboxylase subunit beta [Sporobacter termitidis]|uniref:sodium ion-translocating decarboxylase subunit beta n=1 Tax=Sporobacter termitidis TaxID=44749 RepID=UPI003BFA71D7